MSATLRFSAFFPLAAAIILVPLFARADGEMPSGGDDSASPEWTAPEPEPPPTVWWVDPDDARHAAIGFVALVQHASGGEVFNGFVPADAGPSTCDVYYLGEYSFLVTLAPHGHLMMSGVYGASPVAYFSEQDFDYHFFEDNEGYAEIDDEYYPGSFVSNLVAAIDLRNGDGWDSQRHGAWDTLIGIGRRISGDSTATSGQTDSSGTSGTAGGTASSSSEIALLADSAAECVAPLLFTRYDQSQPYNDYAPVYKSDPEAPTVGDYSAPYDYWAQYRGRAPIGCVATVWSQIFNLFRWPARWDRGCASENSKESGDEFNIRPFARAGTPVDWNAISAWNAICDGPAYNLDEWFTDNWFDMRRSWPSRARHEIAKLSFICATMAHAKYRTGAPSEVSLSTASYPNYLVDSAAGWYDRGEEKPLDASVLPDIENALRAGVPLPVRPGSAAFDISDHIALIDGFVRCGDGSDTNTLLHINLGWGGADDAWLDPGLFSGSGTTTGDDARTFVRVGFTPLPKPQMDPLPTVIAPGRQIVSWHFPDFHTNALAGWLLRMDGYSTSAETRTVDFSQLVGEFSDPEKVRIDTAPQLGGSQGVLKFPSVKMTTLDLAAWQAPDPCLLSSRSVVSFSFAGKNTLGRRLSLQANFDGGAGWTNIVSIQMATNGTSMFQKARVFLGDRAGSTARFRIRNENSGNQQFDGTGFWEVDDFSVSDAFFPFDTLTARVSAPEARQCLLPATMLRPGAAGSLVVVPEFATGGTGGTDGTTTGATTDATTTTSMAAMPSNPAEVRAAGMAQIPIPGWEGFSSADIRISNSADASATASESTSTAATGASSSWAEFAHTGAFIPGSGTLFNDNYSIGASASLPCGASGNAMFSFDIASTNGFGIAQAGTNPMTGYDVLSVVFSGYDGSERTLLLVTNKLADITSEPPASGYGAFGYNRHFEVDLSPVAGLPGQVSFSAIHPELRLQQPSDDPRKYGFFLSGVSVTGVREPVLPDALFRTEDFEALGTPEILSVSTAHGTPVKDGILRECARNGSSVIYVKCSPSVVSLETWSSDQYLLYDPEDVAVHPLGGGEFALEVMSNNDLVAAGDRTRLYLQLEASDANGTKAFADLVLRFSSETATEDSWAAEWLPPGRQDAGGAPDDGESVWVPYNWLIENGLANPDPSSAAFARAAASDTDGDGMSAAAEYACGTNPQNGEDSLRVDISFPAGSDFPNIDWSPRDGARPGYETVLQGRAELGAGEWEDADETRHKFFRVTLRHVPGADTPARSH